MKTLFSVFGAALLLGGSALAQQVGDPAPAFEAETTAGETISLSDFEGRKVVLEWTNAECPFVQKHYGANNMQSLQKRMTADGTVWITVNSSAPGKHGHVTPEDADRLTEERGAAPTHVVLDEDGAIGRAYGAKTTPHMYVIDEEGVLRYNGAIDTIPSTDQADVPRAENYVVAALDSLDRGQAVVTSRTQPYGCSVKY